MDKERHSLHSHQNIRRMYLRQYKVTFSTPDVASATVAVKVIGIFFLAQVIGVWVIAGGVVS